MRILLVSHRYPPAHRAGTEHYSARLAAGLAERGHEVHIACAEKDVTLADGTWRERVHEGLCVHELVRNLFHEDFRATWDDPHADALLAALIARLAPDVVHVQHLLYLSSGWLAAVREGGAALVFTAHDYWLECPRLGQLVHADGTRCDTVDFARCGTCLPSFEWRQPRAARGVARAFAGVRAATGLDIARWVTPLTRRWRTRALARSTQDADEVERFRAAAAERSGALRERFRRDVQHVFAPSHFLRERLVAWGLDPTRVEHLPTGVERRALVRRAAPGAGAPVRVLFLGSFVPLKGAHVLLDAWGRIPAHARAGAVLELFGPRDHAPAYCAELERSARAVGAHFGGPLDRAGVDLALARADVLVVPSLWFENRPLVMLEALAAGVPLVASDLGGMRELVEPGKSGWRFAAGDADDLARRLEAILLAPGELARHSGHGTKELPSWAALVERCLEVYGRCRAERASQATRAGAP